MQQDATADFDYEPNPVSDYEPNPVSLVPWPKKKKSEIALAVHGMNNTLKPT